jgi:hypothetical protein
MLKILQHSAFTLLSTSNLKLAAMQRPYEPVISAEPLKTLLEHRRGSKSDFARKINVSPATLTNWFRRGIPAIRFPAVLDAMGMAVNDYYAALQVEQPLPATWYEAFPIKIRDLTDYTTEDLPRAELGSLANRLSIGEKWFRTNFPESDREDVVGVTAPASGMEPTFAKGDMLLVDEGVQELKVNGVYVCSFRNVPHINRLQLRPDGSVALLYDNKIYDPVILPSPELNQLAIFGQVIWCWSGRRV